MGKTNRLLIFYSVLLVIAVASMIFIHQSQIGRQKAARDYPEIATEGVLRLVTEYSTSGYFIDGDTIRGFQYELSQAISHRSGLEVQNILEMNLAESFRLLDEQACDIIARNIPITTELKEKYLFTDPIILDKQVLVQRKASANGGIQPLRNQLELAGKTLYIAKDSPARLRIRNLQEEMGDTIYLYEDELYSDEQLIILVAHGDIDFAVCDYQVAQAATHQFPEIDIQTDISFTQLQSWAVRKDSPVLLDSLNRWLYDLKESGLYTKIHQRYFPEK